MSYSEKFLEIMNSNIRPKCEPKITVSGTAEDDTAVNIVWNAKDIKSLTFHRSIDPVGRNLPVMELQWTEVYKGKFNSQNFPFKYTNVSKLMAVNLEFHQYLGFYQTWKTLKALTWKEVKSLTWKKVKEEVAYETIKLPTLFLKSTPEVSGQTIKWTAVDPLSFWATKHQSMTAYEDIPYYTVLWNYIFASSSGFPVQLSQFYDSTLNYILALNSEELLGTNVVLDGEVNSEMVKYLSPKNRYLDFDTEHLLIKAFSPYKTGTPVTTIPLKMQYKSPKYEFAAQISRYSYKKYQWARHDESDKELSPSKVDLLEEQEDGTKLYALTYIFEGYGIPHYGGVGTEFVDNITSLTIVSTDPAEKMTVTPVSYNSTDSYIEKSDVSGEIYSEDNSLNVYTETQLATRYEYLSSWFNSKNHIVSIDTPALLNLNVGELANVETMMYNEDGTNLVVPSMLLEYTLSYTGALKQTSVFHELQSKTGG